MNQSVLKRRVWSSVIALAVIASGYWSYTKIFSADDVVRYVTAQVQKGVLIVSVTNSGQVSVSNQVDIKPKTAGDLTYVGVKNGQEVRVGALIAQLDTSAAQKTVRDAEISLESAKLTLTKLKLSQEQESRGDALNKNYEDGMGILADLYDGFSATLNALNKILFGNDLAHQQSNIEYYAQYNKAFAAIPDRLQKLYLKIKELHRQNLAGYQSAVRGSGEARGKAIQSGYELTVETAGMIKTAKDVIRYLQDSMIGSSAVHIKQTIIDQHSGDLASYATTIDTYAKNLLVIVNTINSQADTAANDPLDLRSQELAVEQRADTLADVKEKLADYFVRAPFDGVMDKLDAKKGDTVSSATVLGTLVTKQKIAEISLNEIDVTGVKVGQKATLTFDAVPDLTITGQVTEVETMGTVSQGVVTYAVKIAFDTQDERIKPSMSVSATIITVAKPNVLLALNSAVKSDGEQYVEMLENNIPRKQTIETGLFNDEFTEVVNGLNEGDYIVTRTIQPSAGTTKTQTQQPSSGLRIPGLTGGGMGR